MSEVDVVVNSEAGLLKAIRVAPVDEASYVIGLSKDIVLKKSLEIPDGKNITLTSDGGDVAWRLVGANNQNTINVLGFLVIDGIVVTHVENGCGRGVYVESKGTLILVGGEISGNVINESGGGVYNMGNFEMSAGMISGNNASEG
ncbi:MAG: hypothetical protein LBE76_07225, partial [Nitrososphaerota archaeon]|nr:hypothetical protein [Nitrososphaerota archaeon]